MENSFDSVVESCLTFEIDLRRLARIRIGFVDKRDNE
jgi:hypothetical protein